ncbi:MAG: hypothetical protein IK075_02025 [Prevotella sp.]|nr:hypothetical protein [Prevotella sp.]
MLVLSLTSCYDEKGEDYTPATKEAGAYLIADASEVKFAADAEQVLTLKIGRTDASVSSVSLSCDNSKFNVPSSVTLSSDVTEVKIPFNMQGGTTETATFSITAGSTPYGAKDLVLSIIRDFVWVNIGTGLFTSEFFGEAWEQPILQAEGTHKYILPSVYAEGYDLAFELTEDGSALAGTIKAFETGYVHPDYGMIRGRNLDLEGHPMVRDGNAITIPLQFVVDAGSFGWANETIELP